MLQLEFFDQQKRIATISADPAHIVPAPGDVVSTWETNGVSVPALLEVVNREFHYDQQGGLVRIEFTCTRVATP